MDHMFQDVETAQPLVVNEYVRPDVDGRAERCTFQDAIAVVYQVSNDLRVARVQLYLGYEWPVEWHKWPLLDDDVRPSVIVEAPDGR